MLSSDFTENGGRVHMVSVGINYSGDYQLWGCHNDVESLKEILFDSKENRGFYKSLRDTPDVKPDDFPSIENIRSSIEKVYSIAKKGDLVFFTFSGHGGQVKDLENGEEKDGKDECIYDANLFQLKDDDLYNLLVEKLPSGVKLIAILDCCHSGTGLDLPWAFTPFKGKSLESGKATSKIVYCISGCRDSQTSADAWIDKKAQGALTANLCSLVKENLDLRWKDFITLLGHRIKKEGYEQIPVLSYSYSSLEKRKFSV